MSTSHPSSTPPRPSVDVIIPAYNESEVIRDCLQSFVSQTYSNFRVHFIDDQSTDDTKAIIQEYVAQDPQRFHLHEFGKVGPGKARNLVAYNSTAEILAFTDADCIPQNQWIEELVLGFLDTKVASTGGPHLAPIQSNPFQLSVERFLKRASPLIAFYKRSGNEIVETRHNPLCNVAYRRDIFARLRGFREDLFPGEDVEMDQRITDAGYRITYNPKAVVFHHRPESIERWNRVMHAYGRAQGKLVRESGPRRVVQWAGISALAFFPSLLWASFRTWGLEGLILSAISIPFTFYFRPMWNNSYGIWIHALQWLNGFLEGFFTNRSDPPGFNPLSLQERVNRLKKK